MACWRGRDDANGATARGERLEVRLITRSDAEAETAAVARQRIFHGLDEFFRIHRLRRRKSSSSGVMKARPCTEQDRLSNAAARACAKRPLYVRVGGKTILDLSGDARGLLKSPSGLELDEHVRETASAHPRRNPQPPAIPSPWAGLPDARPPVVDPLGRREPAHQPRPRWATSPVRSTSSTNRRSGLHPRDTNLIGGVVKQSCATWATR